MKNELKEKRIQAGLKQGDVAEMLEVSRQTVAAWEKGAKKVPKEREMQLKILFTIF